jgi:hypothetical protein
MGSMLLCRPGWLQGTTAVTEMLLLALVVSVASAQTIPAVFAVTGKSLVLSTPDWTLLSSLADAKGTGTGVFMNGTKIYTFSAPKNKVRYCTCRLSGACLVPAVPADPINTAHPSPYL